VIPTEEARIRAAVAESISLNTVDATVIPAMQMLLPRTGEQVTSIQMTYAADAMPWWGHEMGKAAAALISNARGRRPPDGAPGGGPTLMEIVWVHSLGKLDIRAGRVAFDEGTTSPRKHWAIRDRDRALRLAPREDRPQSHRREVDRLLPHMSILYHTQPESSYMTNRPSKNHAGYLRCAGGGAEEARREGRQAP
jgi:hypothetical protein